MSEAVTVKGFFGQENVKAKFQELLGQRSAAYITSILSAVNQNGLLQKSDPQSIYMAAMMAASLDLPVNPSIGAAYIVPYGGKAQLMVGWKGFVQLALRSGQFKTISATPIYEGQLIEENPLTGFVFDFKAKTSSTVIGYAAYFSLLNGFEKTAYMSIDEVRAHGQRFSKSFNSGPWKTDFDAMACKTVLKHLLDKYAPKSIEMQRAQIADQSVVKDVDTMEVEYVDQGNAAPDYEGMEAEIRANLNDGSKDYAFKKGEVENITRILDGQEKESYQKALELMASRLITKTPVQ